MVGNNLSPRKPPFGDTFVGCTFHCDEIDTLKHSRVWKRGNLALGEKNNTTAARKTILTKTKTHTQKILQKEISALEKETETCQEKLCQ